MDGPLVRDIDARIADLQTRLRRCEELLTEVCNTKTVKEEVECGQAGAEACKDEGAETVQPVQEDIEPESISSETDETPSTVQGVSGGE